MRAFNAAHTARGWIDTDDYFDGKVGHVANLSRSLTNGRALAGTLCAFKGERRARCAVPDFPVAGLSVCTAMTALRTMQRVPVCGLPI